MFAARDDFIVFCEGRAPLVARDVPCLPAARGIDELTAVSVRDLRAFLAYGKRTGRRRPARREWSRRCAASFASAWRASTSTVTPHRCCGRPKKREALPDVLDRRELSRLLDAPTKAGGWRRQHAGKAERDASCYSLSSRCSKPDSQRRSFRRAQVSRRRFRQPRDRSLDLRSKPTS
ncbi:MAG: hypothetical protein ACR2H2_12875 [Solirubrobacteraceae bacterium]